MSDDVFDWEAESGCQCAACNMRRLRQREDHRKMMEYLDSPEFAAAMEAGRAALAASGEE